MPDICFLRNVGNIHNKHTAPTYTSTKWKYANTCTRTRTHTHARTNARTHKCTHARTNARTHAQMHARTHKCTHARTYTCTPHRHACGNPNFAYTHVGFEHKYVPQGKILQGYWEWTLFYWNNNRIVFV